MDKSIWYISKYGVSPRFGNPTRHYFLAKYLRKLGPDVTLVTSRSSELLSPPEKTQTPILTNDDDFKQVLLPGPTVSYGINIKRLFTWLQFEFQLIKWIKKQPTTPDYVIASSLSILTLLTGVWMKKKYGVSLVVEIRDIHPLSMIEVGGYSKWLPPIQFLSWAERRAYRYADLIVGSMPNLKDHVKSLNPTWASKCINIPMGYDPEYFHDIDYEKANVDLNFSDDLFIVGYVGSFSPSQATGVIFDVIKNMDPEFKGIHFLLVGDGPEKEAGLKKISNCNNYTSMPRISKEKVQVVLSKCDVVLNPWKDLSIYRFGVSPNKWIDYMIAGKPIIVCYNGYRSIINEANCGSFIEAENPKLLEAEILKYNNMDRKERQRIGINGRKFLEENLSYQKLSKELLTEMHRSVEKL